MDHALDSSVGAENTNITSRDRTAYFKTTTVLYRTVRKIFVTLCVLLVGYMMYLSHSYKYIWVASSALMPLKIVLGVAVALGLIVLIWHKQRGHTVNETIKFVWTDHD